MSSIVQFIKWLELIIILSEYIFSFPASSNVKSTFCMVTVSGLEKCCIMSFRANTSCVTWRMKHKCIGELTLSSVFKTLPIMQCLCFLWKHYSDVDSSSSTQISIHPTADNPEIHHSWLLLHNCNIFTVLFHKLMYPNKKSVRYVVSIKNTSIPFFKVIYILLFYNWCVVLKLLYIKKWHTVLLVILLSSQVDIHVIKS